MKRVISLVLILMLATLPMSLGAVAEAAPLAGELKYVSMWNETEPQADVIKQAIEEFQTLYPDVKITVDWMGRDTLKTIKTTLDAEQVDLRDQGINQVIVNYNDYGLEMDEMITQPSDLLDGQTYEGVANPALLAAIRQNAADGKIHGIPYQPNLVAVWYNKAVFAEAGIEKTPETWAELMEVCEKIKAIGKPAFSVDDGYITLPFGMYLGRTKGIDFNKDMVLDTTGAMWDDPAVLEAAKAYETMWQNGYFSQNVAANMYPAGQNEVAMGDAAMYMVASYMPNECLELTGPDFEWGAFAFPSAEGAALSNTANTYGMQVMQIAKTTKNPEAAFAFVMYLTTGKYDALMAETCNAIPTAADTVWPALIADAKPILDSSTENVPYNFNINANPDFTPIYKEQAQKLLGGVITAEEFVENCKNAVMGK